MTAPNNPLSWGKCPVCDAERKVVHGVMKKHTRYIPTPDELRFPGEPFGEMVICAGSGQRPIQDVETKDVL